MRVNKTPVLFDFGENWKAAFALVNMSSESNSSLSLQKELDSIQYELDEAETENQKISSTLNHLRSTLDFLSTSDANSPITANISTNDLTETKNPWGRPKFLQTVRMIEVTSTESSSRTIRERSRSNEKFLSLTSMTKQNLGKDKQSKITQVASLMRRDKEVHTASAEKANLKIIAKFTPEQAASLKRELSFEQWRVVERLLTDVAGRDIVE